MKIAASHPPFFFVLPKKNAPCTVEEKGAGRDLFSAKVRPGVSSDAAAQVRKSPAGCAIHRCLSKLCRRKSRECGGYRGGKPKGLSISARAFR